MSDSSAAVLYDASGNPVEVSLQDGIYKINIVGKVTVSPPPVPDAAVPVFLVADTPLAINSDIDNTPFVIPSGKTFYLTQIVIGAAGDPTEKGSASELYFTPDGSPGVNEKLVQRLYVAGFTATSHYEPFITTRDGTAMLGDGTAALFIRRRRLSGSYQEVDCLVQGYTL